MNIKKEEKDKLIYKAREKKISFLVLWSIFHTTIMFLSFVGNPGLGMIVIIFFSVGFSSLIVSGILGVFKNDDEIIR